jgi:FkbM family methyltransferase
MDYEYQIDRLVTIAKKVLPKPVTQIIEIGARDCAETIAFTQLFPAADIITFECNPDTLPRCRKRVADHPRITLVEMAIGKSEGEVTFYKSLPVAGESWNPGASSLFPVDQSIVKDITQSPITVPMTTLADAFKRHAVNHVDILWMDIQGGELAALEGTGSMLSDISLIHCEVEFYHLYKDQPLFSDIHHFLRKHGFALLTFTAMSKNFGDAVFVNTRIYRPWLPDFLVYYYHRGKEKIIGKLRVVKMFMFERWKRS